MQIRNCTRWLLLGPLMVVALAGVIVAPTISLAQDEAKDASDPVAAELSQAQELIRQLQQQAEQHQLILRQYREQLLDKSRQKEELYHSQLSAAGRAYLGTQQLKALSQAQAIQQYSQLAQAQAEDVSRYWIGVHCTPAVEVPIDSELSGHVGPVVLKGGLRVTKVTPNAPAARAGVKVGDVIISVGGNATNSISQLTQAIGKASATECELQVIRNKKPVAISIRPEKRPRDADARITQSTESPAFYYVLDVPENLELELKKRGSAKARIWLKRGDQSWEATAADVHELPADIRGVAERLLQAAERPWNRYPYPPTAYYPAPNSQGRWRQNASSGNVEQKLDRLMAELKKLRETIARQAAENE